MELTFPTTTIDYPPYRHDAHVVLARQCVLSNATALVRQTNVLGNFLAKFGASISKTGATTLIYIAGIISGGSRIDMARVAAWRIVTMMTTVVTAKQPIVSDLPRDSVSWLFYASQIESAMSFWRAIAKPRPAGIRAAASINLRPETLNLGKGIIGAHSVLLTLGAAHRVACRPRRCIYLSQLYTKTPVSIGKIEAIGGASWS